MSIKYSFLILKQEKGSVPIFNAGSNIKWSKISKLRESGNSILFNSLKELINFSLPFSLPFVIVPLFCGALLKKVEEYKDLYH